MYLVPGSRSAQHFLKIRPDPQRQALFPSGENCFGLLPTVSVTSRPFHPSISCGDRRNIPHLLRIEPHHPIRSDCEIRPMQRLRLQHIPDRIHSNPPSPSRSRFDLPSLRFPPLAAPASLAPLDIGRPRGFEEMSDRPRKCAD